MDFTAVGATTFPCHQSDDTRTHRRDFFDELLNRAAFTHGTAAFRATIQWFFDLLIDMFRHGTIHARMPRFAAGPFFLIAGNFFVFTTPKGSRLSGVGSLLLFELFSQQTILVLQGGDGLFHGFDSLQ